MESYKHQFAKETVARWLRETDMKPLPLVDGSDSVFLEYPVCINKANLLIGLNIDTWPRLTGRIPTYQQCINRGLLPLIVYDVAAFDSDGWLTYGVEVVHRHNITASKAGFHRRVFRECPASPDLYRVSADWVLSQCGRPPHLEIEKMRLPEKIH